MFRFTIRDLLWLMVVIVIAVAWCLDRHFVRVSAWEQGAAYYRSEEIDDAKTRQELRDATLELIDAGQERERLEEEVRGKQLQIEQLLNAPSTPN